MTTPAPSASDASSDREKAVKMYTMYVQARTCNVLAAVFAVCGFFVFASVYQQHIAPDVMAAMHDVSVIGMVIFPFVPALVLSFFAKRYEKRYLALMNKQ